MTIVISCIQIKELAHILFVKPSSKETSGEAKRSWQNCT
jgi:hypothetical protein